MSTLDGQTNALIIVLYGRLDVFWDGDEDAFTEFNSLGSSENSSTSDPSDEFSPATTAAAERLRFEVLTQLRKTPLAVIRRGQTFGDQSLGLALDKLYPGAQLTRTSVPIRLTSGDAVTELIWISRALYEEHLREDRVSLSYYPLSSTISSSSSPASPRFSGEFRDWATHFFAQRDIVEREPSELGELSRRMLADAKISKLLFQFPPLVLERVCHAMELRHFETDGLFLGIGDDIAGISIVVHGALRILAPPPVATAPAVSPVSKSSMLRTSSAFHPRSTATVLAATAIAKPNQDIIEQFLPGDIFGALELLERSLATSSRVVYVQADTLILSVPRVVFERWLAPLHVDTIFNAGSSFQRLTTPELAAGGRSQYAGDKMGTTKPAPGPTRRQSMVLKPPASNSVDGFSSVLTGSNSPVREEPSPEALAMEDVTLLLKKMGIFPLIPRFLLNQLLQETNVVHKQAGDVLFHENEESQYLVVLLSGFLSFYSLEHMSTTLEMFQKHSFCHFSSFQGSQINPEDFVADGHVVEETGTTRSNVAIAKHRAAMHGVHIQTLHAHNAFRTGVLLDGMICPATVVAQTNCECLVLEESVYVNLLKSQHKPAVDLAKFEIPSPLSSSSYGDQEGNDNDGFTALPPGSLRSILSQRNPSSLHPAAVKLLEQHHAQQQLPWLTRSPLKMQQLLRGMRCVNVLPGERLIRCNDVLDHLIIVLSGKLSLFIRQNEDVSTFLDASQRSVRSLMLERSVTSNYSTTSQQLYKEAHSGSSGSGGGTSSGTSNTGGGVGRIASRHDAFAKRKIIRNKISRISESRLFLDSVLAAVHEEKLQKRARGSILDVSEHQQLTSSTMSTESPSVSALHHDRNRATPSVLIHSAAAKAKLQQKIETRRVTRTGLNGGSVTGSFFLCHLGPGEVFGDEILAPHGIFRSAHDVFVDASISPGSAPTTETLSASPSTANFGGAQLILLDRQLFHAISSKADDELENELRVRSKFAKSKWHKAERTITRKLSQVSIHRHSSGDNATGGGKGASKLFDLFKNILNQRCFLTMRVIAEIPLLRNLSDASKRELCLVARFEALERGMNAYKENGAHSSGPRYYFLLNGRVGLYGKNLNGTFFSYSSSAAAGGSSDSSSVAPGGVTTTTIATENCLREVLSGNGFGEFELLVPEFSRCISALALESCRLLSFPAAAFLKHWPHTLQMKSDIEYLRTRVSFFSRLELEKIAYLYTTLSFQTFTRGSSVFEQNHATASHFSTAGELYLLKEGTCAIRQRVVLDRQQTDGNEVKESVVKPTKQQQKLPTHRPEKHLLRVMVTVADVSDGHLFWLDGGVNSIFPFTLQAVSASVTITNVAIDKLRAILPRTQLAALEKASSQMAALYRQQFDMAERTVVTLMNEKRAAQMGMTPNATFLPVLNFQSPQKVIPTVTVSNSSNNSVGSADTSIPFSRLLMARPVDLVALQSHEREAKKLVQPEEPSLESDTSESQVRYWCGGNTATSVVEAVYQHQHLSEHYQLEHGLPNSTLFGSFPDDCSLRRRQRSGQRVPETSAVSPNNTPVSSRKPQSPRSSTSAKADECLEPEPVVGATSQTKLSDSASHIHLEVKVPIFHDSSRVLSPRVPTPPSTSRPMSRGGASVSAATAAQASNLTPRSPRFSPGFQEIGGGGFGNEADDERFYDLEIDLRALLRAEMKNIDAPMRMIKLEPSLSKVNALGQYLTLSSPPPASISAQPRQAPPCLSSSSEFPKPKLKASTPFKIFPRSMAHVRQTPMVPFPASAVEAREPNQGKLLGHEQASVRKQGFLCVVTVLDSQTPLASVLPRVMQHRRRFFSLVDNVLIEYPANVAITELSTVEPLSRYHLDEQSGVSDVPVGIPGEAQATLQMSFVVTVDTKTRLILTAESATEKRKWMKELSQACALGPRSITMHQQILQPQDLVPELWNEGYTSPSGTPRGVSRGPGSRLATPHNAAYAGAALGFEVEYRIG